jgi:hypothetical protein
LLFQLGEFAGSLVKFEDVEFLTEGGTFVKHDLLRNGRIARNWKWINIVPAGLDCRPIDPESATKLYSIEPAKQCDQPGRDCPRDRRLHWDMKSPRGILTYWQGAHGWRLAAGDGITNGFNRLTFSFLDPFVIEVYADSLGSEDKPLLVLSSEEARTIRIVNTTPRKKGDIGHGARHDPAWPTEP